jgi:hypothetical protein
MTYPKEKGSEKKTYTVGDRIDVEAGRVHEVWMGPEGCTYVIGEWYTNQKERKFRKGEYEEDALGLPRICD